MAIPILTYHAMNIHGDDVATNDLEALSHDVEMIVADGWRVAPLADVVRAWLRDPAKTTAERIVALTCDDGSDFDFRDIAHPTWGMQSSVLNRLREASLRLGVPLHATTFVIVSPEARTALDKSCMVGRGWWNEDWWPAAAASPYMHVASHSWDHNHDALPESFSHGVPRGTFATIGDRTLAELEIRQAQRYLSRAAPNPGTSLFAYPYGESNAYLRSEYLPREGASLGLVAALGASPRPMDAASDRWDLPRFIHGRDWTTPEDLRRLLADCG